MTTLEIIFVGAKAVHFSLSQPTIVP